MNFWKIKQLKDKQQEKLNQNLRERVRYEARDTLKIIERLQAKGFSSTDILRDIENKIKKEKGQ